MPADSAAATHAVLDWLHEQGRIRDRVAEYSLGWSIGEAERAAITALPTCAWSAALDADVTPHTFRKTVATLIDKEDGRAQGNRRSKRAA